MAIPRSPLLAISAIALFEKDKKYILSWLQKKENDKNWHAYEIEVSETQAGYLAEMEPPMLCGYVLAVHESGVEVALHKKDIH